MLHRDVMGENFAPGALDGVGIPRDGLQGLNPRTIVVPMQAPCSGARAARPTQEPASTASPRRRCGRRPAGSAASRAGVEVEHPERGRYRTVDTPIKLLDSLTELTRSPLLGEHTDPMPTQLGFDASQIAARRADGAN